jgi:hypothetical protein
MRQAEQTRPVNPAADGNTISLTLPQAPAEVERDFLNLGLYQAPDSTLTVNSRYLELDGKPWLPVMGEFHYSRYPEDEWETELRKMRAGGVDIVATYVLWNHHQELEGPYDWTGRRNLRRFVTLAQRAGLYFYLRPGPWAHAEVRNGGFPDWLLARGPVRCNDAGYLEQVARLYNEIGAQLRGLMWRDGGPVIGVQLENEYDRIGPGCGAEHIAELKRLAISAGLTVPLYTVTGWPTLDIPPRDVVPVSGAYADGFWSGETGPLPPSGVFLFNTSRVIGEMGNVGGTPAAGKIDQRHYPFFLAEAGGGMHVSYHRRVAVTTDDVAATALVQLGSGANLYGYYMYHGGTNPAGKATPLHETQESGYPNDVPVMGYDFRAPLGQYGQLRPSYGRLRCQHLFMAAFGAELAVAEAVLADGAGLDASNREDLRVAVRATSSEGGSGFLFVNNHLRHHPMPDFPGQRFGIKDGNGAALELPSAPVDIPSGAYFIWPFGQRIGAARLAYATAQPLTRFSEAGSETWVCFSNPAIDGGRCEVVFDREGLVSIEASGATVSESDSGWLLHLPAAAGEQFVRFTDTLGQQHTLLVLTQAQADQCYRFDLLGRERIVLSEFGLHADGDKLTVSRPADRAASLWIYPGDDLGAAYGFAGIGIAAEGASLPPLAFEVLDKGGDAPAVRLGPHVSWRAGPVPLAPGDAEYEGAIRVRLAVDAALAKADGRVLLNIDYIGDTARLYADGVLVDDNFNDGEPWYVGLDRYARDGGWPQFELRILPLPSELPVFFEEAALRRLRGAPAGLRSATPVLWLQKPVPLARKRQAHHGS